MDWLNICLLFLNFLNLSHSSCVWPTALKLGCAINFEMLLLVMEFICMVDEITFMLMISCHFASVLFNIHRNVLFMVIHLFKHDKGIQ